MHAVRSHLSQASLAVVQPASRAVVQMWWQFLSSPPLQFAVMWANFLLLAKFPATQQWLSGQFASSAKRAMLATFVVQAVYVSRKLWNSFTALVDSNNALVAAAGAHEQYLSKIASTSQVTATRANVVEWRSCLQSIAKWHQCNLQTAYRRWQCGQVGFPSAPASQWGILDEGQPMHVQDQFEGRKVFNLRSAIRGAWKKLPGVGQINPWGGCYLAQIFQPQPILRSLGSAADVDEPAGIANVIQEVMGPVRSKSPTSRSSSAATSSSSRTCCTSLGYALAERVNLLLISRGQK